MDIGDLLFLVFISIGVLSSLLGGKKKKPAGRPGPAGRPQQRIPGGRPPGTFREDQSIAREQGRYARPTMLDPADAAAARDAGTGHPATPLDHFERILRELGVEQTTEEPEGGRPPLRPAPPTGRPALARPAPPPPPVVDEGDDEIALAEARHEAFHRRYAKPEPVEERARVRRRARAHIRPTHSALREAVIWREILGPPKALE